MQDAMKNRNRVWWAALLLPVLVLMAGRAEAVVGGPESPPPPSSPRHLVPGDRVLVQVQAPLRDPATGRSRKAREVYEDALRPTRPLRFVLAVASVNNGELCSSEGRCVKLEAVQRLHVLRLCEDRKWCLYELLLDGVTMLAQAAPGSLPMLGWERFCFPRQQPERWTLTAADPWALEVASGELAVDTELAALGDGPMVDIGGGAAGLGMSGTGVWASLGRAVGGLGGTLADVDFGAVLSGLGSGIGTVLVGVGSISLGGLGGVGGGGAAGGWMVLMLAGLRWRKGTTDKRMT